MSALRLFWCFNVRSSQVRIIFYAFDYAHYTLFFLSPTGKFATLLYLSMHVMLLPHSAIFLCALNTKQGSVNCTEHVYINCLVFCKFFFSFLST